MCYAVELCHTIVFCVILLYHRDFDPEEYDRQMAAAFDDEYYEQEDDTFNFNEEEAALFGKDAELERILGERSLNSNKVFNCLW